MNDVTHAIPVSLLFDYLRYRAKIFRCCFVRIKPCFYIDIFEQTALQIVDYIYKSEAINKTKENIQILAIIII